MRLGFEEKVLRWPQVSTKKMFGCPCYRANSKLFAFLVTNGVVITQLSRADRERIARQRQAAIFQGGKRIVQDWLRLPIENRRDLGRIMPFVRKSYAFALRKA